MIDEISLLPIIHDWFFDLGQLTQYYRLIETCNVEEGGLELPCNPANHCRFEPKKPEFPPNLKKCAKKLLELKCAESYEDEEECLECAKRKGKELKKAGCTKGSVKTVCTYAESNNLDK